MWKTAMVAPSESDLHSWWDFPHRTVSVWEDMAETWVTCFDHFHHLLIYKSSTGLLRSTLGEKVADQFIS